MRIDAAEVRRLAGLARLRVDEAEATRLAHELSAVVTHLHQLLRVSPATPEPLSGQPVEARRTDEPSPSFECGVMASLAGRWEEPYLLAPPSPVLRRDGGNSR
jgi:aspartyl/glutamyl-tRNA(Asn/Gln) amidotransferase C subunit